jgi:hypothetical protein
MSRRLKQLVAAPLIAGLVLALPVRADDHLVSSSDISGRLAEAASLRQADISTLHSFLATPAARQAAKLVGADAVVLSSRLAHLTDSEARDLAQRARGLTADPAAAGLSGGQITLIVVGGVLALALVTWLIYEATDDEYYY